MRIDADLAARAVIAAAVSYGDDPVRAITAQRGPVRRCMFPAAAGLADGAGIGAATACRLLGLGYKNLSRGRDAAGFGRAKAAAEEAVRYALNARTWPAPPAETLAPAPAPLPPSAGADGPPSPLRGAGEASSAPARPVFRSGYARVAPSHAAEEQARGAGPGGRVTPVADYLGRPPADPPMVRPSALTGARVAGKAAPISDGARQAHALDLQVKEHEFVARKRAAGVPWAHIAQQLVVPVADLRRRHDPDFRGE